ncbi:MAG: type II secretion system protein GspG [Planctomycetota bacterium]
MMLDILIGLATISILAGMIFPLVIREEMTKRENIARDEIQLLGDALQLYFYEHGQYPETLDDPVFQTRFVRGTLSDGAVNDQWGANVRYSYQILEEENPAIRLYSRGPNGVDEEGEGDDILLVVSSDLPATRITRDRLQDIRVAIRNLSPTVRWEYEPGGEGAGDDEGDDLLGDLLGGGDDDEDEGGSEGFCPENDTDEDHITICHRAPGNGNTQTMTIGASALAAHLAHGDVLGACPEDEQAGGDGGGGLGLGPRLVFEPAQLTGDWLNVDRALLELGPEYARDGWGSPFQSIAGTLSVFSPGPDGIAYTADDVTF